MAHGASKWFPPNPDWNDSLGGSGWIMIACDGRVERTNYNNNDIETGDIAITANTNVVLAFEDDLGGGGPLTDFEAVWTLYDSLGNLLITPTTITNIPSADCISTAEALTNATYRAFFR